MNRRVCRTAVFLSMLTIAALVASPAAAADDDPPAQAETPAASSASPPGAPTATPITGGQRLYWIVDGTVGTESLLLAGPWSAAWNTAWNTPEEWGRTWSGFGKRYLQREADVAISSTIEAGLGAIWGEDPRFVPSRRHGIWPRAMFAIKTAFVAPRPDGHLAPAWGRYAGNVFNNVIENTWLPPSVTTPGQTAIRSLSGMGGRIVGNLWDEFWPDAWRYLKNRRHH
jgi:hypothetical protein